MASYFAVQGSSASGDIIYTICHVILHDYLIEGASEFIGRSIVRMEMFLILSSDTWPHLQRVSHHTVMFCGHCSSATGDIKYLIHHVA